MTLQVDVIVNSLSVSMNVEHGILTTAVSSRAGPGLQKAIDEFPGPAKYGDVFKTAGFKLKARAVYHVVVCGFNYPDAGDVRRSSLYLLEKSYWCKKI